MYTSFMRRFAVHHKFVIENELVAFTEFFNKVAW